MTRALIGRRLGAQSEAGHGVSPGPDESDRVFTEFYRVLPSFTGFYRVLPGFQRRNNKVGPKKKSFLMKNGGASEVFSCLKGPQKKKVSAGPFTGQSGRPDRFQGLVNLEQRSGTEPTPPPTHLKPTTTRSN